MTVFKEKWLNGINQTEKSFIERWKKSTTTGKWKLATSFLVLILIVVTAVDTSLNQVRSSMLDNDNGVWRIQSAPDAVVKIDLSGPNKRIRIVLPSMGNQTLVSLGDCKVQHIDQDNDSLFLSCVNEQSHEPVQTAIRQIFNKDRQQFRLLVSSNDRPEEALSFVRNLDPSGN